MLAADPDRMDDPSAEPVAGAPHEPRRADPDALRHARHALEDRVRTLARWTRATELLDWLEVHTEWGTCGHRDGRRRTLDNWLQTLRGRGDAVGDVEYERVAGGAYRYRGRSRTGMSLESATLVMLAERFLSPLLPADLVEAGLDTHFERARDHVERHGRVHGRARGDVERLLARIDLHPRGQGLAPDPDDAARVATVTSAILKGRCLEGTYAGKTRRFHPCALLSRPPKFHLVAIAEPRDATAGAADIPSRRPYVWVVSRFERLELSGAASLAPEDFSLPDWLAAGGHRLALPGAGDDGSTGVVLRVHDVDPERDALLEDLERHPLGADQRIEREGDGRTALLHLPHARADVELANWTLERAGRVEAVAPATLRRHVAEAAAAIASRHGGKDRGTGGPDGLREAA